jgi:hypothetical protein
MRHALLALLLLPSIGGCAVRATTKLLEAEQRLRAASTAGAADAAPYEYTLAVTYLEKAREETGYSDYSAAEQLARKSVAYADAALARVGERRDVPAGGDAGVSDVPTAPSTPVDAP